MLPGRLDMAIEDYAPSSTYDKHDMRAGDFIKWTAFVYLSALFKHKNDKLINVVNVEFMILMAETDKAFEQLTSDKARMLTVRETDWYAISIAAESMHLAVNTADKVALDADVVSGGVASYRRQSRKQSRGGSGQCK